MNNIDDLRFRRVISAQSVGDLEQFLATFLADPCYVIEDDRGEPILIEARQQLDLVDGLKIELYANEHPPPHFHVKGNDVNASFTIDSCSLVKGKVSSKNRKKIEYWHRYAKPRLIEFWNKTRPSDCNVGRIAT